MPNGGSLHIGLGKLNLKRGQLSPKPEMEPGPWIRLTVSDTGNGISPNVLPHIFKPFYTTKDPGEGTGLGLAQVHGIVNQHGGAIDVETKTGEGTTFTIYLPAIKTKLPAPSQPESQSIPKGHGEVILVVEDEAMVRAALVESLIAWDYKTLQAANGQEALACIDAHRDDIDIVLSDVVMPTMGGIPLFHTLKEREPNLPVIMLSGHPMESELKDLEEEGLAGWMLKPPKMAALARLLDQALRESDHS
jgi:CheY-like chemotaxis protein